MIIQLILPILPIYASGIDRRDIIEEGDEEYENNHLILISIHPYIVCLIL